MNKQRKAKAATLRDELDSIWSQLEELRDAEQEAYDNTPESLQTGERGDAMLDAMDRVDEALSSIEDAKDALQELLA